MTLIITVRHYRNVSKLKYFSIPRASCKLPKAGLTLLTYLIPHLFVLLIPTSDSYGIINPFQPGTLFRTRLRTSSDVVAAGGSLISRVRPVRSPQTLPPHAESFGDVRRGGERDDAPRRAR